MISQTDIRSTTMRTILNFRRLAVAFGRVDYSAELEQLRRDLETLDHASIRYMLMWISAHADAAEDIL